MEQAQTRILSRAPRRAAARGCPPTVEQWMELWLERCVRPTRARTTVHGYEEILSCHLLAELGDEPLRGLTPQRVQAYYAALLARGLAPNTVRKHHMLLQASLTAAVRAGLLAQSPMPQITPPKATPPSRSFYTPAQLRRLFDRARGQPMEAAVLLAGYLGLRRGEICGLRWENVDFSGGVLLISETRTTAGGETVCKGPKSRSSYRRLGFAAIPELAEKLTALSAENDRAHLQNPAYNPQGYVLQHDGVPYQPDYVSNWFAAFIKRCGLPPVTLHGLRHSFASVANMRRMSLFDIGKALGHSSTAVTDQIYTHLFDDANRALLGEVAAALGGDEPSGTKPRGKRKTE